MATTLSDNVGGWRVSLTNLIIQIDSHVKPFIRVVRSSIVESQKRFGYLDFCWFSHRYVYQCVFHTLVSCLMTFILVIAHVSSAIYLVCSILQSSSASEKNATRILCRP